MHTIHAHTNLGVLLQFVLLQPPALFCAACSIWGWLAVPHLHCLAELCITCFSVSVRFCLNGVEAEVLLLAINSGPKHQRQRVTQDSSICKYKRRTLSAHTYSVAYCVFACLYNLYMQQVDMNMYMKHSSAQCGRLRWFYVARHTRTCIQYYNGPSITVSTCRLSWFVTHADSGYVHVTFLILVCHPSVVCLL